MPSVVEKTFKLKWFVEDFSLYAKITPNEGHWVTTRIFTIDALDSTQWQVNIFPRAVDGCTVCAFQRSPFVKEVGNATFRYSLTISGKEGRVLFHNEGLIEDLPPIYVANIERIPTEVLSPQHLENDRLDVAIEVRSGRSSTPIDISSVKWKDELQVLSQDMRKLFRSGCRSDVELVSSDGCRIRAHLCILFARWRELFDDFKDAPCSPKSIGFSRMNCQLLTSFVSYLYTGTIPDSEMTVELFLFVAEGPPYPRRCFHTRPSDVTFRTRHFKERLTFTWYVSDTPVNFHRILPLTQFKSLEILVDISTNANDNSKALAWFSLSRLPKKGWVHLQCSLTLITEVDRTTYSAGHYFDRTFLPWSFPHLLPLTDAHRVDFELCFSVGPGASTVPSTVTEFHTGSLGVRNVELLATELGRFFSEGQFDKLFDVELSTDDGTFLSCKSFLGARSSAFLKAFDDIEGSDASLPFTQADNETLSSILEYLYSGWTKIASTEEALRILTVAREMALDGLVRKCEQCISIFVGRRLQG